MAYWKNPHNDAVPPTEGMQTPVYWTEMKSTRSLGDDIINFVNMFITPPRTLNPGEEFGLMEWQEWLIRHIFELDENGFFRYRRVYLQIPRKNGKSFLASCVLLYFLVKAQGGEQLYCAAKDSKQARIVYDETLKQLRNNPTLQMVLRGNQKDIRNTNVDAILRVLTADSGAAHGFAPYLTVLDEVHKFDSLTGKSHRGNDLIAAVTTGSKDRNESMALMITTAGDTVNGIAHNYYKEGKNLALGLIEDDSVGFFTWEAEDEDDIYAEETMFKANPSLVEGKLNFGEFLKEAASAKNKGSADYERYALNKWLRAGDKADYVPGHLWKHAFNPELAASPVTRRIPKGSIITVGFDGSLMEDSTAFVAIDAKTGLQEVLYQWTKDELDKEWSVPLDEVEASLPLIMKDYKVAMVYCDANRFGSTVERWKQMYGKGVIRDIPQTPIRMRPMGDSYLQSLIAGEICHVDEPRLSNHVSNAVRSVRDMASKETKNSPNKIDFLVCAILANGARLECKERGIIR